MLKIRYGLYWFDNIVKTNTTLKNRDAIMNGKNEKKNLGYVQIYESLKIELRYKVRLYLTVF